MREALITAFNFEFINQPINGEAQPRITSYFSNSFLAMAAGPADGQRARVPGTLRRPLLPGAIEGYRLPVGDGTERNRANIRKPCRSWKRPAGRCRTAR